VTRLWMLGILVGPPTLFARGRCHPVNRLSVRSPRRVDSSDQLRVAAADHDRIHHCPWWFGKRWGSGEDPVSNDGRARGLTDG
jgi:hypothetical protein